MNLFSGAKFGEKANLHLGGSICNSKDAKGSEWSVTFVPDAEGH